MPLLTELKWSNPRHLQLQRSCALQPSVGRCIRPTLGNG